MRAFSDVRVERVFAGYPERARERLLDVRALIFEVADGTPGVGPLTESLRWGQPAYLTEQSRSGTTVRLGWSERSPELYGVYVHCGTTLLHTFRTLVPDGLRFEGNRAILLEVREPVPREPLALCLEAALTYHRWKNSARVPA